MQNEHDRYEVSGSISFDRWLRHVKLIETYLSNIPLNKDSRLDIQFCIFRRDTSWSMYSYIGVVVQHTSKLKKKHNPGRYAALLRRVYGDW